MSMSVKKRLLLIAAVLTIFCSLFTLFASAELSVEGDTSTASVDGTVDVVESADTEDVAVAEDETEYVSPYYGKWVSILPPIIAIALALITKEVYSSLFVGIVAGALLYANFNVINTVKSTFEMMTVKIGDGWNVGILIFLVILGIMVALITTAGGSAAYGKWASEKIKTKKGATLATIALGALIFVDDYFNCLTVGSVMRPVTDKFKMSRAKLAYIIDATAAPVCIIAPISSWAAAVTSSTEGTDIDGFSMFIKAIPYNYYALLTLVMLVVITLLKVDFGSMKKHELNAAKGDLYTTAARPYAEFEELEVSSKGKVVDLVLPIIVLIVSCITGMVYTGGFFDGESFVNAFANCDASVGLVLGSFVALIFTFLLYIPRKVITFKKFVACIPEGFRSMVPAILILVFAWTLGGICRDSLGIGDFVGGLVSGHAGANAILPAIMFLVALGLAFATGTSWGTFAILIPIALAIFPQMSEILVITVSACLAGAVCGDHISPISDTTIMSSTGAQCDHINHVSTQIPYALLVAAVSVIGFIIAGITKNVYISLAAAVVLMILVLVIINIVEKNRDAKSAPKAKAKAK